jgi:hypothetical protein
MRVVQKYAPLFDTFHYVAQQLCFRKSRSALGPNALVKWTNRYVSCSLVLRVYIDVSSLCPQKKYV